MRSGGHAGGSHSRQNVGCRLGVLNGDLGTTTTVVTTETTGPRPEPTQGPNDGGLSPIALLAVAGLGIKAVMVARRE